MKNRKYNINIVLLYLILIINISFFSLVKLSKDVILICNLFYIIYIEIKYRKIKVKKSNKFFTFLILYFIVLIFTSAYQSHKLYNQSLWLGIRPQRHFFITLLLYFPISSLIRINKITKDDLEKIIYNVASIQMFIQIIYYLSGGKLSFILIDYDYRYGEIRLRADCCLINLLFILNISNFIKGRERNKNLILGIINLLYVMFILKTRLLMLSYLVTILAGFCVWKKNYVMKFILLIFIICVIPFVLNTEIFQNTIETIIEDNSNDIRKLGKEFYRNQIEKSPILGRGYINIDWEQAFYGAGVNKGYYLVDDGITAFLFVYGYLGLVWFILWYSRLFAKRNKTNAK